MPGRHGKQRVKRKKSKRQRPSEMERVLLDSIHNRKRKEREILKERLPPVIKPRTSKMTLSPSLPMFTSLTKEADCKLPKQKTSSAAPAKA
ncbi:hypothetical protein ERJ75_000798500 [Trypanosoma vivax]|nr:hypothetical protein ERJ75_000798500 [Trypanosoma vivax]